MDDDKDKNVVELLVDKINDVVEKVVATASVAAQHAMEAEAKNMTGQPTAHKPVVASDSFVADPMMPPAVMPITPHKRRPARKKAKNLPRKATRKPARKTDKKRKLTRKSKQTAKATARKTAKKSGKKTKKVRR